MTAKLSQSRIAAALADLTIMPRGKVAEKHGMTARSLNRYKAELEPASPLAAEVQSIINNRDETWSAELPDTLKSTLASLKEHVESSERDPKLIDALAHTIERLNDIEMTRQAFKSRGVA